MLLVQINVLFMSVLEFLWQSGCFDLQQKELAHILCEEPIGRFWPVPNLIHTIDMISISQCQFQLETRPSPCQSTIFITVLTWGRAVSCISALSAQWENQLLACFVW